MSKLTGAVSAASGAVIADPSELITVPLESIPFGVPLHYPVYLRVNEKFVLFRVANDVISRERADNLFSHKVEAVYVAKSDLGVFIKALEESLDNIGINAGSEAAALGLRNLIFSYWKVMEDCPEVSGKIFEKLKDMTAKVPITIAKNRQLAVKLIKRYQAANTYFANHSVNISLYAVAIGLKMRLSEEQLNDLSLGACLANIGIVRIPREILYKPTALSEEERAIVREHPRHSEEILKLLFAPTAVVAAARQHHEWFNGKGYPDGLRGEEISLLARIIAIAECYNALTSHRPWGEPMLPFQAVESMGKMEGRFDPKILDLAVK